MKFRRIEFILATAIFIFILIVLYSTGAPHESKRALASWMAYSTVIYGTVLVFIQWISPAFFIKRKVDTGIALTLLLFFAAWMGLAACLWIQGYHSYRGNDFQHYLTHGQALGVTALVFLLIFAYEGIKRLVRYVQAKNNGLASRIFQESLIVLGVGLLILLPLLSVDRDLSALWLVSIPYAYLLFALNTYWLTPFSEKRHDDLGKYLLMAIPVSFVAFIPFGALFLGVTKSDGLVFFIIWFAITLVILPLSHYIYQRQKERIAQLVNLKMELGQASANLSFLRSQINPHFLFNILNTLYGTALQEHAERTASGIQKLGDMMRFMLHENNQDRILLAREIEYLRNYIDLQLLRTATSKGIIVECDIADALESTYIAPMLLIPFVENAFKHGISLREKSWINVSLYESEGKVYFDVHNSIHRKPEADPERGHPGVGLENVKQRLAMLYPGKYDLVIRETTQEYFVHLTIVC
ncbi:Histidine kinase [Parapedobacter composti]|uniref:Histidine kinase n=1 Tax=Parapedobacter composti TaxID=623281 RepID=A0A1I1FRR2_9SPHI|nr:histidine kinase [Parapedobacter composti]SFC02249.1 Histidine kinase [Parapedobacter composti]